MKRADRIIWGNDDVTRASPAPYATRRDVLPLPSYPPLKLSQVADAVFDVAKSFLIVLIIILLLAGPFIAVACLMLVQM